jgi:hypothetical protein
LRMLSIGPAVMARGLASWARKRQANAALPLATQRLRSEAGCGHDSRAARWQLVVLL